MGPYDNDYDIANGAPLGTFDYDGDGELDAFEGISKLNHYESLWDEEDSSSDYGDDDDDF